MKDISLNHFLGKESKSRDASLEISFNNYLLRYIETLQQERANHYKYCISWFLYQFQVDIVKSITQYSSNKSFRILKILHKINENR